MDDWNKDGCKYDKGFGVVKVTVEKAKLRHLAISTTIHTLLFMMFLFHFSFYLSVHLNLGI